MTDGSNLHTGLVFDQSYSSYCGGGSLPLNENPERKTKYHVTLDSMTGYTDDGKVVYKK